MLSHYTRSQWLTRQRAKVLHQRLRLNGVRVDNHALDVAQVGVCKKEKQHSGQGGQGQQKLRWERGGQPSKTATACHVPG